MTRNFKNKAKYRKSIVKSMGDDFVLRYGFEDSYRRFEGSINRMQKEGDVAEELAVKHLKELGVLSNNYKTNAVIVLNTIKIEADIIDFDNKIVYETKSRRTGELAKKACKQKWNIFQYDKVGSFYENFDFHGIVVANYEQGQQVKGIAKFEKSTFNSEKMQESFENHYNRVEHFKKLKRSKGYDINGFRIRTHYKKPVAKKQFNKKSAIKKV